MPARPIQADTVRFGALSGELALKTLTETTKDLEVAAWLTEGLVRSHGLAGLAAGAQLMAGLAEQHWDGLFPLPDDYGMETRISPVTGLNGRDGNGSLVQPLYKLTLFSRPDGTPIAYYQYQQSEQLGTLDAERRQQRIEAGAIPLEELERDARGAGARVFGALLADARAARESWQAMAAVMDEKAGADGPSTTAIRDLLSGVVEIAARYAPPKRPAATMQPLPTPRCRAMRPAARQAEQVSPYRPDRSPAARVHCAL